MHRNLDNRVEAIIQIERPEFKKYLQFLLSLYLYDNQQRWELFADGNYKKIERNAGDRKISTHKILMSHMSNISEPIAISPS